MRRNLLVIGGVLFLISNWPIRFADIDRLPAARAKLNALQTALEGFTQDTGRYPTAEEGLGKARICPDARQNR